MKKTLAILSILLSAFTVSSCGKNKVLKDTKNTITETYGETNEDTYDETNEDTYDETSEDESKKFDDGTYVYEMIDGEDNLLRIKSLSSDLDKSKLKNVTLPEYYEGYKVTEIGGDAFANSLLEKVVIPSSYTLIGDSAFYNSENLKEVVMTDSVTCIESYAFYNCFNLKKINLSSNIEIIYTGTFNCCYSLEEIVIPNSVIEIEYYAFSECNSLYKVTIGKNVNYIDYSAFYDCEKIFEVYNLSGIEIDNEIFPSMLYCHKSLNEKSIIEQKGDYLFINNDGENLLIAYKGNENNLELPNSFTYNIYNYAFFNLDINKVVIPSNVSIIYSYAFKDSSVSEVVLSDGIEELKEYAFDSCRYLYSIVIPKSLIIVDPYAFVACNDLVEVYNLNQDGDKIYLNNNLLVIHTDISEKSILVYDSGLVYAISDDIAILIGHDKDLKEANIKDTVEYEGTDYNVSIIYNDVFYKSKVEKVILPKYLEEIYSCAFSCCYNLKEVLFNENLKTIDFQAFFECKVLESIVLPNSLEKLEYGVFLNCYDLDDITLSSNLKIIGASAFQYCYSLEEIIIPDSVTEIGDSAFMGTELNSVFIPKNVSVIDESAFSTLTPMEKIEVDKNNTNFETDGKSLYDVNTGLLVITYEAKGFDNAIIGAFAYCQNENTKIYLKANTKEIHDSAFYDSYVEIIEFEGTMAQFRSIVDDYWINGSSVETVKCKDGTINVNDEY